MKQKFFRFLLIALVFVVGCGLITAQTSNALIFQDAFDNGSFQPYDGGSGWNQTQFTGNSLGQIVRSPRRAGAGSAKFTLTYPDRRAEKNKFSGGNPGTERWFGLSTYIPNIWPDHDNFTIVTQITGVPASGEPDRSPMLSVEVRNGQWAIFNRWDSNAISRPEAYGNGGTIQSALVYQGNYSKGAWTDWVIHARWSYGDDGLLEIWQNGTRVATRRGPNCYNDSEFHFKIGMYKPGYNAKHPSPLVIYHDEVRIGSEVSSYGAVAPRSY